MAVSFHEKSPAFKLNNKKLLKQWIKETIVKEHYIPGDINFVFDTDEKVYQANVKYLHHDWLTDVIAFEYNEGVKINGDILISVERVRENAEKYGVSAEEELRRVMIHGVLHLCGYEDKDKAQQEGMRKKENRYLDLWEKIRKRG